MSVWRYLFGFKGRINRARMWLFYPLAIGASVPFAIFSTFVNLDAQSASDAMIVLLIAFYYLPCLYVFSAMAVKRLHDRDKSAWWLALFCGLPIIAPFLAPLFRILIEDYGIPAALILAAILLVGVIWVWGIIELLILRGTPGENSFGSDPLGD